MKFFVKYITILSGAFFLSFATAKTPSVDKQLSMIFQVNQEQMVFGSSTIEWATMAPIDDALDQYEITLKLKNDAATKFNELTAKNIGKQAHIMLNGVLISSIIIQTELGGEFLVTGLTKKQAQQFVESLAPHMQ